MEDWDAFQKPRYLMNYLKQIMEYRKGTNFLEKYFENVKIITKTFLRQKADKDELTKYFWYPVLMTEILN